MKTELYDYDIYPKVIPENKPVTVTVRPLGLHSAFPAQTTVKVCPLQERRYPLDDSEKSGGEYAVTPDADGCIRFTHCFHGEQEHFVRIYAGEKRLCQLAVYSVHEDLSGMIPLLGDLHLHTIRSDGREDPAIVAAHLRQQGYDYIAITDHENFSGALEAIDAYQDAPIEMNLMTGEEVHMPDCPIHVVHVGGRYSVNAMVDENYARIDKKNPGMSDRHPAAWRKVEGSDFPGTMNAEEFHRAVEAYAGTLPAIPEGLPRFVYAGFAWVCDQIRKAGGLAIFAHPYWINDMFHVDERLTQYIFDQRAFDAFEVLGGENYFEQNGFQTVHYYEAMAKGGPMPVVGSSDSHSSVNNRNAFIAKTICFARANDTPSILSAIRARRTVAVDAISAEYRLVGEYRLVKYACFLMDNYFPLRREACVEQGRAMKEYYCGDREDGLSMLKALDGRTEKMWRKYFAFDF